MDGFNAREAPSHVLEGLRSKDPQTRLLYLGAGKWLLCLEKEDNSLRRSQAYNMMERLTAEVRNGTGKTTSQIAQRARFADLMYRGFVAIDTYEFQGSPDSSVVKDYERALWLYRNTSDQKAIESFVDPHKARREEARKELQDDGRHRDAWKYAFTRSHAVTRTDPTKDTVKTGRVRHTIPKVA